MGHGTWAMGHGMETWPIPCPMSYSSECHHPVLAEIERQFFEQAIDERGAVLIEAVDDGQRALLWMAVREYLRLRARELAFQRFVATLRRVNDLGVQSLEIVLHFPQRRLRGAGERRIERRHHLRNALHAAADRIVGLPHRLLD